MQLTTPLTATWLATFMQAQLIGDANATITGINEINRVQQGDIVFVDHPKYYDKCLQSEASIIIINKAVECPVGKALVVVSNPFEAYTKLCNYVRPHIHQTEAIHPTATIHPTAIIYPNVVIGAQVTIGEHTIIYPNVTIYNHTIIGNHVVINANSTIGSNAFYYNTNKTNSSWYTPMQSIGNVVIHNYVHIGAGCTIDKGVSHSTIIGEGTKIDNMCHIGHDVVLGRNCLLAAQVGIAGATILQDGVTLWGQVGVNKTITIGQGAIVMGQSGVVGNIEGNKVYWGTPAINFSDKKREMVWLKRIPQLWDKIKNI